MSFYLSFKWLQNTTISDFRELKTYSVHPFSMFSDAFKQIFKTIKVIFTEGVDLRLKVIRIECADKALTVNKSIFTNS